MDFALFIHPVQYAATRYCALRYCPGLRRKAATSGLRWLFLPDRTLQHCLVTASYRVKRISSIMQLGPPHPHAEH